MNSNNKTDLNEDNPQFIFLEKLKAMLITILEKEKINNSYKISLSNFPNLNLHKYFTEIDCNNKDFIDLKDLKKYFENNSISYTDQSLRKLIHFFDKHNNFYLIFEDFSKIFSPFKYNDNYNNYFLNNEKELIMKIFNGYLDLIEQINEMIIDIRKTSNFTTYEAFMGITKGNKYLDEEFLNHFLEHKYNSEEVKNIIYLIDKNNDKLISYEEFQDFLIPLLQYNDDLLNNENYDEINIESNDIVNFEKKDKSGTIKKEENFNKNNNYKNSNNKIDENNFDNLEQNINYTEDISEVNNNKINNENDIVEKNIDENNNKNIKEEDNKQKDNDNVENDNEYKINMSSEDDYDNYCNFYRKTKQVLIPTNYNQIDFKQNPNKVNIDIEDNQSQNELNLIKQEVKNLSDNKNKDFTIVKNKNIILPKETKDNFITIEKEKNTNTNYINNFTCAKNTESDENISSSKKINLNINSNDLENYSLSNDYNNINNNTNMTPNEQNNKNMTSDDNIFTSNKENKNSNNMITSEENNKYFSSDNEITSSNKLNNKEEQNIMNVDFNINISLSYFIKYIQYLLSKEKKTLDLKDKLSLREDISLKELFCIFDYNKRNIISKKEFKVVCKKIFGLYPTSDQVHLVFKRYDKDKDDNLNLKEFLNLIKPLKEEYACFLFNKNNATNKNTINMTSKKILKDVIKAIIEDEGYYYKFKDDLENKNLLDMKEFWKIFIKYSNNDKGIDKLELYKFLNDNGCNLSQYDIEIIFNKIDYDQDDIISYDDLNQEFFNYY